jgi:hypothetical protein
MMQTINVVKEAVKDKAPALFKELSAKGELNRFAADLAGQISEAVSIRSREIAQKQGYSKLMQSDPMKAVGVMNSAMALAREEVFANMLEFPQDETSRSRPDETTPSGTAT